MNPFSPEAHTNAMTPELQPSLDFFTPTKEEMTQGMVTAFAVRCGICGSNADRYTNRFQCRSNPSHVGDLNVGTFSDLSYPNN